MLSGARFRSLYEDSESGEDSRGNASVVCDDPKWRRRKAVVMSRVVRLSVRARGATKGEPKCRLRM